MAQWLEQIRNHPVWQHLQALGPSLDQAAAMRDVDAASLDLVERIRAVHAFADRRLAAIDPSLVYQPALDAVSGHLQGVLSETQAFVSDGQAGHLTTASNSASEVLSHVARLLAPGTPDEITALSEAAESYRSGMEQALESSRQAAQQLRSETETLSQRVVELTADVAAERTKLTSLSSEFQSQFSSTQESRAAQFTDQQSVRQRDFGEAQTARQGRFDELLSDYSKRLNERETESARQREALGKRADDWMAAIDAEYRESAKAVLDEVDAHKRDVEKLVGVIGNLGVTSGYQKAANYARIATVVWQIGTVLALGGLAVFAYHAFVPLTTGQFTWEGFAGRVFMSLSVGVIAAYAGSQADKYMETERRNRKLALELEALGPYIAPLPESRQEEFRVLVGDRTFGREEQGLGRRERSPASVVDVLMKSKEFRQVMTELVKAAKAGQ